MLWIMQPQRLARSSWTSAKAEKTPERAAACVSSEKSDETSMPATSPPEAPSTTSPQEGNRGRTRARSRSRSSSVSSISPHFGLTNQPVFAEGSSSETPVQTSEAGPLPTVLSGKSANFGSLPGRGRLEDAGFATPRDCTEESARAGGGRHNRSRSSDDRRIGGWVPPLIATEDRSPNGARSLTDPVSSHSPPSSGGEHSQQSALYRASMGVVSTVSSALSGLKEMLRSSSLDAPTETTLAERGPAAGSPATPNVGKKL
jgi:hypothetical protein